MRSRSLALVIAAAVLTGCTIGSGAAPTAQVPSRERTASEFAPPGQPAAPAGLEAYDAGFFWLQKPVGWQVVTAGSYSTFGYLLRDPANPARQIVYLGSISPLYASIEQKEIDRWYMTNQGYPVPWFQMPVIDQDNPATVFTTWPELAASDVARGYMPQLPTLSGFRLVGQEQIASPIGVGVSAVVVGDFAEQGIASTGMFSATTVEFMPFMNGPGGGTAVAYGVVGVMAPAAELEALLPTMLASVASFRMSDEYIRDGIALSDRLFDRVKTMGTQLRATTEIMNARFHALNRR